MNRKQQPNKNNPSHHSPSVPTSPLSRHTTTSCPCVNPVALTMPTVANAYAAPRSKTTIMLGAVVLFILTALLMMRNMTPEGVTFRGPSEAKVRVSKVSKGQHEEQTYHTHRKLCLVVQRSFEQGSHRT